MVRTGIPPHVVILSELAKLNPIKVLTVVHALMEDFAVFGDRAYFDTRLKGIEQQINARFDDMQAPLRIRQAPLELENDASRGGFRLFPENRHVPAGWSGLLRIVPADAAAGRAAYLPVLSRTGNGHEISYLTDRTQ